VERERASDEPDLRGLTPDQHKRIKMQNMVDELTSHDRINTSTLSDHPHNTPPAHHTSHHSNTSSAPVLPLINRQLMEPVPSSSMMSMHHQPMHMQHHTTPSSSTGMHHGGDSHSHLMNYFNQPSMYSSPSSGSGRLSHPQMEIMAPLHQHQHHDHPLHHQSHSSSADPSPYTHLPFTLPPPNRSHTNM